MKKLLALLFVLIVPMTALAADVHWTGAATAVAQIDSFTPANVEVDDVFTLTVSGWDGSATSISYTATAATVANVIAGMETAWNASTHALCTPMTADANSIDGCLYLQADTAGAAFSVASSATDGGVADTQTLSRAAVTASAGPSHWDSAANWDSGAVPGGAAGQNVYIEDSSDQILYGLNQSGIANTLASLNIEQTFTGKIGYNGATGQAGTYLQIKATAVNLGYNYSGASASGSGRVMIDTGSTASTVTVIATASTASDSGKPCCRLLADSAGTDIRIMTGKVGIGYEPGETTTLDDLTVGYSSSSSADTIVTVGAGVTVDAIDKRLGTLTLNCGCTSLVNESGAAYLNGTGTLTTLTINSGTTYSTTTGTITTVNADGGTLDLTGSLSARTITNMNIGNGGSLKYDPSVITLTNGIDLVETSGKFLITSQEF